MQCQNLTRNIHIDSVYTKRFESTLLFVSAQPVMESWSWSSSLWTLWLSSNWQEELEFGWKFIFGVKSIREVNSTNTAVGVDLNSKENMKVNDRYRNCRLNLNRSCNLPERLDVVSTVGSSCEIGQVKLNLVPSLIESHWHGADEWLYTSCTLIVRSSESPAHALVVKDLHLEGEIFL